MRPVRRDDARAADTLRMIKGGDSVVVPALRTTRLSSLVQEGKLALRAEETPTVGPSTISCAGRLAVRAVGGFPAPTVVSTAMDRVHKLHGYGGLGRPPLHPGYAYKRRLTSTAAKDRHYNKCAHTRAGKTKAAPSSSIVTPL